MRKHKTLDESIKNEKARARAIYKVFLGLDFILISVIVITFGFIVHINIESSSLAESTLLIFVC